MDQPGNPRSPSRRARRATIGTATAPSPPRQDEDEFDRMSELAAAPSPVQWWVTPPSGSDHEEEETDLSPFVCPNFAWEPADETIDFTIACQPPDYVRAGAHFDRPLVVRSRSEDLLRDAKRRPTILRARAMLVREAGQRYPGDFRPWEPGPSGEIAYELGEQENPQVIPVRIGGRFQDEEWVFFVFPSLELSQGHKPGRYHIDIEVLHGSDVNLYGKSATRSFEVLSLSLPECALPEPLGFSTSCPPQSPSSLTLALTICIADDEIMTMLMLHTQPTSDYSIPPEVLRRPLPDSEILPVD